MLFTLDTLNNTLFTLFTLFTLSTLVTLFMLVTLCLCTPAGQGFYGVNGVVVVDRVSGVYRRCKTVYHNIVDSDCVSNVNMSAANFRER